MAREVQRDATELERGADKVPVQQEREEGLRAGIE